MAAGCIANLLVSDETAHGETSPAHAATHQAASKALAPCPMGITTIGVDHGDGLGAGAHEGVLAVAAHGRLKRVSRHHVDVEGKCRRRRDGVPFFEVSVKVRVETNGCADSGIGGFDVGGALGGVRALWIVELQNVLS